MKKGKKFPSPCEASHYKLDVLNSILSFSVNSFRPHARLVITNGDLIGVQGEIRCGFRPLARLVITNKY